MVQINPHLISHIIYHIVRSLCSGTVFCDLNIGKFRNKIFCRIIKIKKRDSTIIVFQKGFLKRLQMINIKIKSTIRLLFLLKKFYISVLIFGNVTLHVYIFSGNVFLIHITIVLFLSNTHVRNNCSLHQHKQPVSDNKH